MDKKKFDRVINAIDQIRDDYIENHLIIFSNDSERKKRLYASREAMLKKWSKKQHCIVEGCCNRSIVRSHTIQKSGPIATVAKNSVVLTAEFNLETGSIFLKQRGINDASVFPGFCREHEKIFSFFEENKDLHSTEAVILQLYRTICREVFRSETEIEIQIKQKNEYIEFRNERFLALMENVLSKEWIVENEINLKSINIDNDPYVELMDKHLDSIKIIYENLKSGYLKDLEALIKDKPTEKLDNICLISIDIIIPVTLSGFGTFYIDNKTRATIFMGVYPNSEKNETCIILYANEVDRLYLKTYIEYFSSSSFGILNMIEQFMIRGTDHWFINPDIWNQKTEKQKNIILDEILDQGKGITHPINFSIFDDIRREIINNADGKELTYIQNKYLNLEKQKLVKI